MKREQNTAEFTYFSLLLFDPEEIKVDTDSTFSDSNISILATSLSYVYFFTADS